MKINWLVRVKNEAFWIAIVPAIILLIQAVADVFGFVLDLGDLSNKLLEIVKIVFTILAILGIVTDHTTAGLSDSKRALTYTQPKK